jgi:hypothetical protein
MACASDLPYLIRLLDDDDPKVRPVVKKRFSTYQGDISHDLAALGASISSAEKKRLSHWLEPGRRKTLMEEWIVPTGGGPSLGDDWDEFENLLRILADFLHDGITLRPSLPDQLDLLAEEVRESFSGASLEISADSLRYWLFVKGAFRQRPKHPDALVYFDLCQVIDLRQGNATSLGCLYMLLARRLGVVVTGCNYPGHFLTRIEHRGRAFLVDCFHAGRRFEVDALLANELKLSKVALDSIISPCDLGDVLLRYLMEMQYSLVGLGRDEDALLVKKLAATLKP